MSEASDRAVVLRLDAKEYGRALHKRNAWSLATLNNRKNASIGLLSIYLSIYLNYHSSMEWPLSREVGSEEV